MRSIDTDAQFVYNENGLWIQKTVNGVATKYTLHGKNIVYMTQGGNELHFFYDAQNRPAVVVYNGVPYAYVKSLQGDILAILDENGNTVVSYGYDAWGAPLWCTGELAETLGKVQPFRYRGYVFDEETGLYYLRSRYYGSEWCRFINSDSILTLNLFCYCNNQPINNADSNGMLTTSAFAFKCIDDSSSVYLSPSQRAPEAVLKEGLHGKNTGNIPVAYLLAYLMSADQPKKHCDTRQSRQSVL